MQNPADNVLQDHTAIPPSVSIENRKPRSSANLAGEVGHARRVLTREPTTLRSRLRLLATLSKGREDRFGRLLGKVLLRYQHYVSHR
jgi:hypothetical protein